MVTTRTIPRAERRLVLVFFALLFGIYTCVYPYISVVNNPNENVRTYMTMAIVENHTFRIDDIVMRQGWVNDMARAPETRMKAEEAVAFCTMNPGKCHLYSVKAPGVSYLGVPVYWAFTRFSHPPKLETPPQQRIDWMRKSTFVLRLFTIQLPCFVFLIWLERWLRRISGDVVLRLSAVAAVGVGTNYLAYALMFASHSLFGVAAFMSFAITTGERLDFPDARRRRIGRAFWAGFFAGFATLLEYHALPTSVCLALYAMTTFYRPTRLVTFAAGGTLNALALMFFQWRAFNDPLMPGHKLSENQMYAQLLSQGLFGIGTPSWDVAKDITLSRSFGFFGTSSFMWLGVLALPLPWLLLSPASRRTSRDKRQLWLASIFMALTMLALWTTVSAAINWRGGWTVGPRYLGAAPPFFAFGALLVLDAVGGAGGMRRALVRAAASGLAVASFVQSGILSSLYNTIPESVTRPVPQLVVPLLRTSFVPHHALEPLGVMSPIPYFVVLWAVATALLLVLVFKVDRERTGPFFMRIALAFAFAFVGATPAFSEPDVTEIGDGGMMARHDLTLAWEPPGRDRISQVREVAERYGPRGPCLWLRIAEMERMVSQDMQAAQDQARAGGTKMESCQ